MVGVVLHDMAWRRLTAIPVRVCAWFRGCRGFVVSAVSAVSAWKSVADPRARGARDNDTKISRSMSGNFPYTTRLSSP